MLMFNKQGNASSSCLTTNARDEIWTQLLQGSANGV